MNVLKILLFIFGILFFISFSQAIAQENELAPNLMETFERIDRLGELLGDEMLDMMMEMLVQGQRELDKILDELERNVLPPKVEPDDPDIFEI